MAKLKLCYVEDLDYGYYALYFSKKDAKDVWGDDWESEKTIKGHWEKYKITKPNESINPPKYDKVTEGYNPSDKNIINKGDK